MNRTATLWLRRQMDSDIRRFEPVFTATKVLGIVTGAADAIFCPFLVKAYKCSSVALLLWLFVRRATSLIQTLTLHLTGSWTILA